MDSLTNETEFEEGEVVNNDSDDLYTPLERPHIPTVPVTKAQTVSDDDDDDDEPVDDSSSDSDSSTKKRRSSKLQKRMKPTLTKSTGPKKNYNIWCTDLQADLLTNSLLDCNVDQSNERVRSVETYNYKLSALDRPNSNYDNCSERGGSKRFSGGKRRHNGDCSNSLSAKGRSKTGTDRGKGGDSGNTRNILGLTTTVENTEEEIATDIANKLLEKKEDLILRALTILGKEAVISIFEETKEIEASGGMLIMNGTRRRTPGGVFFYLMKCSESLSRDKVNEVFAEDKKMTTKIKKRKANEIKKARAAKFKEILSKDDFPTLPTRAELATKELTGEGGAADRYPTGRQVPELTTYDDDIFDYVDDME